MSGDATQADERRAFAEDIVGPLADWQAKMLTGALDLPPGCRIEFVRGPRDSWARHFSAD